MIMKISTIKKRIRKKVSNIKKRRKQSENNTRNITSAPIAKEQVTEINKIHSFIHCGLFVLSIILISGIGIAGIRRHLSKKAEPTTASVVSGSAAYTPSKKKLPIYCVDTPEKKVALSFDAAWGNEDTGKILDILKKHKVHVTFFMTGGWVDSYPEDVKRLAKEGHDLGNHSWHHKQMSRLSREECKEELMYVHDKIKELTGKESVLFRPPYGDYNDTLIETAKACHIQPIQWDVDSLDWKDYGVESIIHTVCEHKHLGNGSIILCHNGAKYTAKALDTLITNLKSQGYQIVPISKLIYKEPFDIDTEGRQHKK